MQNHYSTACCKPGSNTPNRVKNLAEDKLNIPAEGAERDAMMSGMGKGAMAAGALALLLGTGAGRRLTGSALKIGSLAAIGGLAYKTYKDWQDTQGGGPAPGTPVNELPDNQSNERSVALVKAMIAAAKADGHIDNQERQRINEQIHKLQLDDSTFAFLKQEIDRPLDVREIASLADSPESAAEIYVASLLVIDVDDPQERNYLNELAQELDLDGELAMSLEKTGQNNLRAYPGGSTRNPSRRVCLRRYLSIGSNPLKCLLLAPLNDSFQINFHPSVFLPAVLSSVAGNR